MSWLVVCCGTSGAASVLAASGCGTSPSLTPAAAAHASTPPPTHTHNAPNKPHTQRPLPQQNPHSTTFQPPPPPHTQPPSPPQTHTHPHTQRPPPPHTPHTPTGEGRVHACLRQHRKEISPGCRAEEMLLEQQEAEHIELRPNLLKACADERQSFCKSVSPGSGRVFRWVCCLWVCLCVSSGLPGAGGRSMVVGRTLLGRRKGRAWLLHCWATPMLTGQNHPLMFMRSLRAQLPGQAGEACGWVRGRVANSSDRPANSSTPSPTTVSNRMSQERRP